MHICSLGVNDGRIKKYIEDFILKSWVILRFLTRSSDILMDKQVVARLIYEILQDLTN